MPCLHNMDFSSDHIFSGSMFYRNYTHYAWMYNFTISFTVVHFLVCPLDIILHQQNCFFLDINTFIVLFFFLRNTAASWIQHCPKMVGCMGYYCACNKPTIYLLHVLGTGTYFYLGFIIALILMISKKKKKKVPSIQIYGNHTINTAEKLCQPGLGDIGCYSHRNE